MKVFYILIHQGGIFMNDLQIEALLEVIKHKSFSVASEKIYVPQPTLTHRIKQLEDEVGEVLLYRKSKYVTLTPAGKTFLPYARKIHESIILGKQQLENKRKGVSGTLSIGASIALSQYVLPSLLERFLSENSQYTINISSHPSEEVIKRLRERKFAFGLTRFETADRDLKFEVLYQDQIFLIVSPNHHFSKLDYVDLSEACEQPVLIYQTGTNFRHFIENSLLKFNKHIKRPLEFNNAELIKSMIQSNFGISFLPGLYVKKEIDRGELIRVPLIDNPFPSRNIYLVYNKEDKDGSFQLFLNCAREYFGELS